MSKYRLKSNDAILVIIDLQEKLLAAMPDREKICRNTRILLSLTRHFNMPVLLTEQYPRGLGSTVNEIKEMLPEHHRLERVQFSAFTPEMTALLQQMGRRTILMTGTETHVCVYQTTRDLLEYGFNVHLVKDAVCSRYNENHENGLALMHDLGAVVTNTETVVFDLLVDSGNPAFRSLSALIK